MHRGASLLYDTLTTYTLYANTMNVCICTLSYAKRDGRVPVS